MKNENWPKYEEEILYLYYHNLFFKTVVVNDEYTPLIEIIKNFSAENSKVMELGSGMATTLIKLASNIKEGVALDNSELITKILQKNIDNDITLKSKIKVITSNMTEYIDINKYDLIYTTSLCHIFELIDEEKIILNTYANLKNNGIFIVTNPIVKNKKDKSKNQEEKYDTTTQRKVKFKNKSYIDFIKKIRYNIYKFDVYTSENKLLRSNIIRYNFRFFDRNEIINYIEEKGFSLVEMYTNEVNHVEKDILINEEVYVFKKIDNFIKEND